MLLNLSRKPEADRFENGLMNMKKDNSRIPGGFKRMKNLLGAVLAVLCCFTGNVSAAGGTALKTPAEDVFSFDLHYMPFSHFGSYMSMLLRNDRNRQAEYLVLNDLSGKGKKSFGEILLMNIEPMKGGKLLKMKYTGTPTEVRAEADGAFLSVFYEGPKIVHCYLRGADLHLKGDWGRDVIRLTGNFTDTYILREAEAAVTVKNGKAVQSPGNFMITPDADGVIEVVVEQYYSNYKPRLYTKSRKDCLKEVEKEYGVWEKRAVKVSSEYEQARKLATYLNWSCIYEPRENITRYGMAMSKRHMIYIWSWDHCFNALSLSGTDPRLAWDQYMIMFDHQDKTNGSIPDLISPTRTVWASKKPPIHGWILSELMKQFPLDDAQAAEVYEKLKLWTEFWFTCRDEDGNGLPQYHNGCDSGWDNGTAFDMGFPAEGADLAAFLILQMDELSKLADRLGKTKESGMWKERSEKLLDKMIAEFWDGSKFVTRIVGSRVSNEKSMSLMGYLPIILGKKLPAEIRSKMIAALKKDGYLLTEHGLATESPASSLYAKNGYWRGPIWAPTTYIVVKGLSACGEEEFAKEISRRFCDMCREGGFAENFDALTGAPLRDRSYTWTSSVFLVLMQEYLTK